MAVSKSPKGGRRRHPAQREEDMTVELDLYKKGHSLEEIRDHINNTAGLKHGYTLSLQTISNDIRAIRKKFIKQQDRGMGDWVAEILTKIDWVEQEYLKAWFKSMAQPHRSVTTRKASGKRKVKTSAAVGTETVEHRERTEKHLIGDPVYLQGVERCILLRCRVLKIFDPNITVISPETFAKELQAAIVKAHEIVPSPPGVETETPALINGDNGNGGEEENGNGQEAQETE